MTEDQQNTLQTQLAKLKAELHERESSIPIHSIRPHQLIEIEELEEQIEDLEQKLDAIDS